MKTVHFMLFLLAAVFLAGCDLTIITNIINPGGGGSIKPSTEGTDGLTLKFFEGAPPESLLANVGSNQKTKVNIGIMIENRGVQDLNCNEQECGYFRIDGGKYIELDKTFKNGTLKQALESSNVNSVIPGKIWSGSGGRVAIETQANLTGPGKTTRSTIFANVCYPYKTSLSTPICVETAHYSVENRVCDLRALSFSSQGAPVAITRIDQDSVIDGDEVKPRLGIHVRNVGSGFVIGKEDEELKGACTAKGDSTEIIGKITVESASLSGKEFDCVNKEVFLHGGVGFFYCVLKVLEGEGFGRNAANNLVSPFSITLAYGYRNAESKTVNIEVLDEKPQVIRVSSSKTTIENTSEMFYITVTAIDDNSVEKFSIEQEGKTPINYTCNGGQRCNEKSESIELNNSWANGSIVSYTVKAYDNQGGVSEPKKVSIKVGFCNELKISGKEYSCQDSTTCSSDSDDDENFRWRPDNKGYECRDEYHICCVIGHWILPPLLIKI